MQKPPRIPKELLDHLTQLFPVRPPETSQSDREIWIEVGRQKIIAYLKTSYEAQQKRGEII